MLEDRRNARSVHEQAEVVFVSFAQIIFDEINRRLKNRIDGISISQPEKFGSIFCKAAEGPASHDPAAFFIECNGAGGTDLDAVAAEPADVFIDDRPAVFKTDNPVQAGMGTLFTLAAFLVSNLWLSHTVNADVPGLSAGADVSAA